MDWAGRVSRAFLGALLAFGPAWAGDFQPKTYSSPSRQYSLFVDPSDRSAAGGAHYVLRRGPQVVWSGDKAFTLWDAFVTDDGMAGGYAYSAGYDRDAGDFVVALLDSTGSLRLEERKPREGSHFLHTAADPKARGLFVNPEARRFVVRVADPDLNRSVESWWTYSLDDGHQIGKPEPAELLPADADVGVIIAARSVDSTPLTLVQWVLTTKGKSGESLTGARFTLVDAAIKSVWTLDLPGDYTIRNDAEASQRLYYDMLLHGAILDTARPATFEIQQAASRRRITFAVEQDGSQSGKWNAHETARTPLNDAAADVAKPVTTPDVSLRKLAPIDLGAGREAKASPIHDVSDYAFSGDGRIGLITNCGCSNSHGNHSLVIVDGSGELVREIILPAVPGGEPDDHVTWLRDAEWLVTTSTSDRKSHSTAVVVNADSGAITPLPQFAAPPVESVAGSNDGGFVALTKEFKTYTIEDTAFGFDSRGRKLWEITEGNDDDGPNLFAPAGIAVTTTGQVAVLENIADRLKVYGLDGKHQSTIDLRQAWGRKPNYLAGLHADVAGGVIVYDFHGSPPIVRMSLTGEITGAFKPTFKDGHQFDTHTGVRTDTAGKLWTSDGSALLRLDDHGVVDRVLGSSASAQTLGEIAAVAVTNRGWIYAADERTGAIHVFDPSGKLQRVCRPLPTDYKSRLILPSLTVADSGDVFVTRNGHDFDAATDFLHYDAKGQRVGVEFVKLNEVSQTWLSQPGTTNFWILGYERAYRVDSRGSILRRLDRTATGEWLETPGPAAVAPDGSFAVISGARGDPMSRTPPTVLVTIFTAEGTASATWPAPSSISMFNGAMAFDGHHVAFVFASNDHKKSEAVLLTDTQGAPLLKISLAAAGESAHVFFVNTEGGAQLWVFDGKSTIDRYAWP